MNIRFHIDSLVLNGFHLSRAESLQVKAALERELGYLLSAQGLGTNLENGSSIPLIKAGTFAPPHNVSTAALGRHIARSVHGGIRKAT